MHHRCTRKWVKAPKYERKWSVFRQTSHVYEMDDLTKAATCSEYDDVGLLRDDLEVNPSFGLLSVALVRTSAEFHLRVYVDGIPVVNQAVQDYYRSVRRALFRELVLRYPCLLGIVGNTVADALNWREFVRSRQF